MTIHEYCNARRMTLIDPGRYNWPRPAHAEHFPRDQTDVLTAGGAFFVASNRVTGRFVAQTESRIVSGFADAELTAEQKQLLMC